MEFPKVEENVWMVTRLNNSKYGSPRYRFHCGPRHYWTSPDSQVSYEIVPDSLVGKRVRFTLDALNDVIGIEGVE